MGHQLLLGAGATFALESATAALWQIFAVAKFPSVRFSTQRFARYMRTTRLCHEVRQITHLLAVLVSADSAVWLSVDQRLPGHVYLLSGSRRSSVACDLRC
jgi:hypothetical protein